MLRSGLLSWLATTWLVTVSPGSAGAEGWRVEIIATGISASARNSALALDADGRPHVAFYGKDDTGETNVVYAVRTASGWDTRRIDPAAGDQCVLRLDSEGAPRILYNDRVSRERVRYGMLVGEVWETEDVHPVEICGREPDMALDAVGIPHIVFIDNGCLGASTYYGTRAGDSWTLAAIGSGSPTGGFLPGTIALDDGGRPIVLGNQSGFDVALEEDGQWTVHHSLGPPALFPPNSASVTGGDGRIHVSGLSFDDQWLVYLVDSGLEWTWMTVESVGWVGLANTSIALDPDGNPHISYEQAIDGSGRTRVRYASFDGEAWTTEYVTTDVTVQSGTSLAIDVKGTPHVVYWRPSDGGDELVLAVGERGGPHPFRRGDPNGDGRVDIADPVWILNELFRGGPPTTCGTAGDSDGNGEYDPSDAIFLVQHRYLHGPPPPAPFPDCGAPQGELGDLSCGAYTACGP